MNKFLNKYLFLIAGILISVFPAIGNNIIRLSEVKGTPGSEVTIKVNLNSAEAISAIQLTTPLNDVASVILGSGMTLNRASGHSISCGVKDGSLNLMIYSTGMNSITSGNGEIAEFKLRLGDLPMRISPIVSVKATDANGKEISCQAEEWTINVTGALVEFPNGIAYDYGHVPLRNSYKVSIPVKNTGGSNLEILSLEFSASEFSSVSALPFTVEPGGTKNLEIGYSPVERGAVTESVRIISNSYSPNNVLKLLADPYSVNEIRIHDVSGISDTEVEVVISMNNMDRITGFTLEFDLPSQLEYVDDSFGLSDRKTDHMVSASYTDSKLKAMAYSLSNSAFKDENGNLASFKVKLKGTNEINLQPSKTVLSAIVKGQVEDVISAVYPGKITVRYPNLNASSSLSLGRTPITESVSVDLIVNNNGSAPLIIDRLAVEGIDLNIENDFPIEIAPGSNSEITLYLDSKEEGELEGWLHLYTNDPENRLYNVLVNGERYSPNSLSLLGESIIRPAETGVLSIVLDNYNEISGFQFDVTYPTGFEPLEPLITERTKSFIVNFNKMGNNMVRYICYSLSGNSIPSGSGNVFELPFSLSTVPDGSYQFLMNNVKLSTPEGVNKSSLKEDLSAYLTIGYQVSVQRITLNPDLIEMQIGKEFNLTATVYPDDATNKLLVWESSDENVVTVDQSGRAKITGEGSAVIIVTAQDGSGVKAECIVTGYAGIDTLLADPSKEISVYSLDGKLIKKDIKISDLKILSKGIYLITAGKERYKVYL